MTKDEYIAWAKSLIWADIVRTVKQEMQEPQINRPAIVREMLEGEK